MYRYAPRLPKRTEKMMFFFLVAVAVFLLGVSHLWGIRYAVLCQVAAICLLTGATLLLICCLLVRYAYSIDLREDSIGEDGYDLTVTRYFGKRITVVCRISVSSITAVMPVSAQNRRERAALIKGKPCYRYTACLLSKEQFLLETLEDKEPVYVQILADRRMISLMSTIRQQLLSNGSLFMS